MFRPDFFKLPLIALTLVLAYCVSAHAQPGTDKTTAGNQQQEAPAHAGAQLLNKRSEAAGNLQGHNPIVVFRPATFVCAPPVAPLDPARDKALLNAPRQAGVSKSSGPQPRPIPPGKQLKDLCPAGTAAYTLYAHIPHELLPPPFGLHTANPQEGMGASATAGNLHKPQPDTGSKSPAPSADTGTTTRHP